MHVDDLTIWPETAEVTGREADELLGQLVAPLPGALGLLMLDISRGILAEGGSVTVIRQEELEEDIDVDMAFVFADDFDGGNIFEPELAAELDGDFAVGEGFPSRMRGIGPDDPLECLTQLVPDHLRHG